MMCTIVAILLAAISLASADPCRDNHGGCDRKNGICWSTGETTSYCSCKAGFRAIENSAKHRCGDVDECAEENVCGMNAHCVNSHGSYECLCKCGYILDYTGKYCLDAEEVTGLCYLPNSCLRLHSDRPVWRKFDKRFSERGFITNMWDLKKVETGFEAVSKSCECEDGFRKNECGLCEDVNECDESIHECYGRGSECFNTEGGYYCECGNGYAIGPCGTRCYDAEETMPTSCDPDVAYDESTERLAEPFATSNWKSCANDVGIEVFEERDMDNDGVTDLSLSWICGNDFRGELEMLSDREAKWEKWTCWTSCKPTCWGGLQTRTRQCKHGMPGEGSCVGKGSESRECYTGKKCPFRVRKDASTLNDEEIQDLTQAMKKYKEDMTAKGFHNAGSAHGWPFQCDGEGCCPHGAKLKFLAWHRSDILNYEEGLSRYLHDKTLGIPYWNWLAKDKNPPEFAWSEGLNGEQNPFSNMTVLVDRDGPMRTIQRDEKANLDVLDMVNDWVNITESLIKSDSMHEFAESLEIVHGNPHVSVCTDQEGKCNISFAEIAFAGFDPLFLMHHSQVDRLWAVAQKIIEESGSTTWTAQSAIELGDNKLDFSSPYMPFGNKAITPFPILHVTNNMRNSYYYKELTGVVYDYLDNNGFPPDEPQPAPPGVTMFYIAHYLRSVHNSRAVYVNYYFDFGNEECKDLTKDYRIGAFIIMPTTTHFRNAIPALIPVPNVKFEDPYVDFPVKACYTNAILCDSNCPDASNDGLDNMPTPALVHHLRGRVAEIYKFNWSPGSIMPAWRINFESSRHWIHFYGSRAEHIVRVNTRREWSDCDSSSGWPFDCSGDKACIMPPGRTFLIDVDNNFCYSGLRMIVRAQL